MVYVVYGNEPYMVRLQKEKFKKMADSEFGYQECQTVLQAVEFLTGCNLFCEKCYAYLEVDSITELTKKTFLDFVAGIKDSKDRYLMVYIRKVKPDAKGFSKLSDAGCNLQGYNKLGRMDELLSQMKLLCEQHGAHFTDDALKCLAQRLDYLGNDVVNMITVDNYIDQLRYLSDVIDVSDVENNTPDMREGQRFALASMIAKGWTSQVMREIERLKRERDFSGMALMGLLHREYRIAYLNRCAGYSCGAQKVRCCNLQSMEADKLLAGINTISACMKDVKTGAYSDTEAFDLCVTKLLMITKGVAV